MERGAHHALLPLDEPLSERIDRHEHADDFVVNGTRAGERAVQRRAQRARDSDEE